MFLPADGNILLSLINTKLRDKYSSLEELCEEEEVDYDVIVSRLAASGYSYDKSQNTFK